MNHINLIRTYCVVLAQKGTWAIWYREGHYGYADIYSHTEGWVSYACNSREEWAALTER